MKSKDEVARDKLFLPCKEDGNIIEQLKERFGPLSIEMQKNEYENYLRIDMLDKMHIEVHRGRQRIAKMRKMSLDKTSLWKPNNFKYPKAFLDAKNKTE